MRASRLCSVLGGCSRSNSKSGCWESHLSRSASRCPLSRPKMICRRVILNCLPSSIPSKQVGCQWHPLLSRGIGGSAINAKRHYVVNEKGRFPVEHAQTGACRGFGVSTTALVSLVLIRQRVFELLLMKAHAQRCLASVSIGPSVPHALDGPVCTA